jgi:multidrug efflux pump subunit AcrB
VTGLYAFTRRHAATVLLVVTSLVVFGLYAALHLPSGIYPEVDFPRIAVVVHAGDAPADVTVATVTRPLESAVATVPGVRRVHSRTNRGASEVNLTFVDGTDMPRALAAVQSRVEEVRVELGSDAEIAVERLTPIAFPVLTFNLSGPLTGADLYDLAQTVVRPALSRVDGVGLVSLLGGDMREEEVLVHPDRAAALRLDVPAIAFRISDFALRSTAGHLVMHHQAVAVETDAQPLDSATLGEIPIAVVEGSPVPLRAVADVLQGAADRTAQVSGPSGETVLVSVSRMEGASTPAVADDARKAAQDLAPLLPKGARLDTVYDQAATVDDAIGSVRDAILLGIVLCVGVLGLMLRDWRAGSMAAATVPLTLAITFGGMWLGGQTLNLMSLGGMAVAIGLVVDDAIVVVEAIARRMEEGETSTEAAARGLREMFSAVVGRTLTTVFVFLPMSLLSGVVGSFFSALAWTLSVAVVVSMLLALVLLPLAAGRWLKPRPSRVSVLDVAYGRAIRVVLRYRTSGLVGTGLLALLGVVALLRVPTGFLPTMDEGGFVLDYFLPAGTSLSETSAVAARIENVLREVPEVRTWSRRTGAELGPAAATEANSGDIMVRLVDDRDQDCEGVMDDVRGRVEEAVPEARIELFQVLQDVLNDLAGVPHPVELKLFGPDPRQLEELGVEVAGRIEGVDGLVDLYSGVEAPSPNLRFITDPVAAERLGLSPRSVSELLEGTLSGVTAASLPWLDRRIDIRVRAPDAIRFDPVALASLPLIPGDPTIPVTTLAAVARPMELSSPTSLEREDLRPVVVVSAEEEGGDLGGLISDVKSKLEGLDLPEGVALEYGGAYAQQQATFKEMLRVLALAIGAVGTVLVAQFRSFRLPLYVMITAPVALVGAALTLWLLGVPLNASSSMGAVLLVGLVVKNGILLLEHAEGLRNEGVEAVEAMVRAGERRLRPILLTTLCTVFGLLPLALGIGSGAELQRPLAVAVIGGLAVSTAVVLFLLPALAVRRR